MAAGTTVWLEVPLTKMGDTREKKYLGVGQRDFSSGHLKLKMQASYSEGKQGVWCHEHQEKRVFQKKGDVNFDKCYQKEILKKMNTE